MANKPNTPAAAPATNKRAAAAPAKATTPATPATPAAAPATPAPNTASAAALLLPGPQPCGTPGSGTIRAYMWAVLAGLAHAHPNGFTVAQVAVALGAPHNTHPNGAPTQCAQPKAGWVLGDGTPNPTAKQHARWLAKAGYAVPAAQAQAAAAAAPAKG